MVVIDTHTHTPPKKGSELHGRADFTPGDVNGHGSWWSSTDMDVEDLKYHHSILGTLVALFTRLAKLGLVVYCRIASVTVLVALMHTVADLVGAGRECLDTRSSRQHAGGIYCDLWEEDKFVDQLVI
jgi:hypothetical protein